MKHRSTAGFIDFAEYTKWSRLGAKASAMQSLKDCSSFVLEVSGTFFTYCTDQIYVQLQHRSPLDGYQLVFFRFFVAVAQYSGVAHYHPIKQNDHIQCLARQSSGYCLLLKLPN
jgi:hypothetical protein